LSVTVTVIVQSAPCFMNISTCGIGLSNRVNSVTSLS
jgi:hypothetical protein